MISLQVWILLTLVRLLLLIPKQDYPPSPPNRTYHFFHKASFSYPIRLVALWWNMYGTWKSIAQYCFSRWRTDERWVINKVIWDCFAYLLKGSSHLMPLRVACLSKYSLFVFFKDDNDDDDDDATQRRHKGGMLLTTSLCSNILRTADLSYYNQSRITVKKGSNWRLVKKRNNLTSISEQ